MKPTTTKCKILNVVLLIFTFCFCHRVFYLPVWPQSIGKGFTYFYKISFCFLLHNLIRISVISQKFNYQRW